MVVYMVNNKLKTFLIKLGLDNQESDIFASLCRLGPATVFQLAKESKINRTTLYRRIEEIQQKGLLETIVEEKRLLVKTVDFAQLENLVLQKADEAEFLQKNIPIIKSLLNSEYGMVQPGTKVLFYKGQEGIRQMVWHTLRAKSEIVGFTFRDLTEAVGLKFASRWHEEFLLRGLRMRDIIGDEYLNNQKTAFAYSQEVFQSRYLPSSILSIDHQTDIYDDVVAFYNWHEGEVFGVEIQNDKVASMQRQIFEILWGMGQDEPKL